MSYAAQIINGVHNVLLAQAQGAGGGLPMEASRIFQASTTEAGGSMPYLVVRLPQEPYSSGVWGATGNLRNGMFIVDVDVVAEVTPGNPQPYGSDALPGPLTYADDVMDILEAGRSQLINSGLPHVYDYELTSTAHQRQDGRLMVATIRCAFKTRFIAGAR